MRSLMINAARRRVNRDVPAAVGERTVTWDPRRAQVEPPPVAFEVPEDMADRVIAGRYRLGALLGAGGMGEVWLAQDEVLRRAVALKCVAGREGDQRPNVLREARAAAAIAHPGVVRVHDVLIGEDGLWIVMEALPGQTLSTTMRDRGRLPADEVVPIALRLLSALQAIHAAGLVHRDVKPSNVQICDGDRVVLTDFGLSSPRGVWGGLQAGEVAGSLPFLAPESIIDGCFGPPSDLYALGVTLYRAVEGRRPFDLGEPFTAEAVLSRSPLPATHAGCLAPVLDGLLENDPTRRLDIGQARSALRAIEPDAALVCAAWENQLVQIGMLGSFEVRADDGVLADVPGARLRALLIALALEPGRVVPKATLVDWIWGEFPPSDAANALQRLVSRLRKALPDGLVEGQTGGYRLTVAPDAVDAVRFERLVGQARNDEGPRRVRLLREALALWRGAAMQDVGLEDSEAFDAAVTRLEGLRLTAMEDRFEAEVSLGHGAELVAELTDAVTAHPLQERLVAALMRALVAAGRDTEALLVYERTREALADALGVDPSPELSALHVALLRGELGRQDETPEDQHPCRADQFRRQGR